MVPARLRRLSERFVSRPLGVAWLVGLVHASVVLWTRSALGIYTNPMSSSDVFAWAFIGLTIVGGVVTYLGLVYRLYTPALGVFAFFGWATYNQWQYLDSIGNAAPAMAPQPLYLYIALWPLPLLVGITLAILEWGGKNRRATAPGIDLGLTNHRYTRTPHVPAGSSREDRNGRCANRPLTPTVPNV